jgi:hypothetical protein
MSVRLIGARKQLTCLVLAAFSAFVAGPAFAAAGPAAGAAGTGSLTGFVFAKDVKTPVAGAVIKIRNLADMKELASPPTDANGMYTITGIPEGRYVLGISAGREDFNLDYALYVKSGELGKLSVALSAGGGGGQEPAPAPPKKKGFFSSVAGRVLVVTVVGVGLYFLIVEPESSPIR